MVWWHLVTMLCNHHHYLVSECYCYPKRSSIIPFLFPVLSQPIEMTNLLPVSVDLPVLHGSYECDPTICDLWCLASFDEHSDFEIIPCHVYHYFIHFYGQIVFHCVNRPYFVHPFIY